MICYLLIFIKSSYKVGLFLMKKQILFLLFVVFSLSLLGCEKSSGKTEKKPVIKVAKKKLVVNGKIDISLPGDPIAGARVFKRICVACHGMDGRGNHGVTAADFLKEKERLQKDNKVLLNSILNGITEGTRVMPPQKGILTDQQIKDALSYVRKHFGQKH